MIDQLKEIKERFNTSVTDAENLYNRGQISISELYELTSSALAIAQRESFDVVNSHVFLTAE